MAAKWRRSCRRTPVIPSPSDSRRNARVTRSGRHGVAPSGESENTNADFGTFAPHASARSVHRRRCTSSDASVVESKDTRRLACDLVPFSTRSSLRVPTRDLAIAREPNVAPTSDHRSAHNSPRRAPVTAASRRKHPRSGSDVAHLDGPNRCALPPPPIASRHFVGVTPRLADSRATSFELVLRSSLARIDCCVSGVQ